MEVNPESYNHVPLMIHVPGGTPQIRREWALQMDVQPTLLALLGIGARQHNFGVDLNRTKRPCAFYTADNVICARDSSRFYVYEPSTGQEHFYRDGKNADGADSIFSEMRNYLFSMIQSAQYLLQQGKTTVR